MKNTESIIFTFLRGTEIKILHIFPPVPRVQCSHERRNKLCIVSFGITLIPTFYKILTKRLACMNCCMKYLLSTKRIISTIIFLKFLMRWFQMYDFTGDISTTYTGETDNHLSGVFETYNNLSYLSQWSAPCNKLNGSSDGTKFPTGIKPDERLSFFRKSLCRSMPMVSSQWPLFSLAIYVYQNKLFSPFRYK